MVDAGEQPSADEGVEARIGVAPVDVNPLAHGPGLFPRDGNAVRRVFRRYAQHAGHPPRPHLAQPDQADAGHAVPLDELGAERLRQERPQAVRVDAIVREDAPVDDALDDWDSHQIGSTKVIA